MDFTASLTELPEVNATMERWLYGTKELERKIFERIVSLCRYFDRIPEQSLLNYADALIEALNSKEIKSGFITESFLDKSIFDFIKHLKSLNNQLLLIKANKILACLNSLNKEK